MRRARGAVRLLRHAVSPRGGRKLVRGDGGRRTPGRRPCAGRTDAQADRADRPVRRHDTGGLPRLGQPRSGAAPAPRGVSARAARVGSGRPSRRVAVPTGDRPVVLDALSRTPPTCSRAFTSGASRPRWSPTSPSTCARRSGRLGSADCVDEFVLSFEVGAVKPDAAIFETALDAAGRRGRARSDGRRQRGGRRRGQGGRLRVVHPRRPAAARCSDPMGCGPRWLSTASWCDDGRAHPAAVVAQADQQSVDGRHEDRADRRPGRPVLTVPGRKSARPRRRRSPRSTWTAAYVVGGFPGADWVRQRQAMSRRGLSRGGKVHERCGWWS